MTTKPGEGAKPSAESLLDNELEAALAKETQAEIDATYMDRVDKNHPILSVAEQLDALKKADLRVTAERKKQAMADFIAKEEERLKGKKGLSTGDPAKDELVWITLELAEHADRITINGTIYMHGGTYHVPRHLADTLREVQSRTWRHQNEIEGKAMADLFRRPQNQVLSGKAAA